MVELDYKTVKKEVWAKFIKIYGGGPSIIREKPFIYSNAVDEKTIPQPTTQTRSPSPFMKERTAKPGNEADVLMKKRSQPVNLNRKNLDRLPPAGKMTNQIIASNEPASAPNNINRGASQAAGFDREQIVSPRQEPLTKNIFAKKLNNQQKQGNKD